MILSIILFINKYIYIINVKDYEYTKITHSYVNSYIYKYTIIDIILCILNI